MGMSHVALSGREIQRWASVGATGGEDCAFCARICADIASRSRKNEFLIALIYQHVSPIMDLVQQLPAIFLKGRRSHFLKNSGTTWFQFVTHHFFPLAVSGMENVALLFQSTNLHPSPTPACAQLPPLKHGHFEGPNGPQKGQSQAVRLGRQ